MPFGGTDCALPMLAAAERHPHRHVRRLHRLGDVATAASTQRRRSRYRQKTGIPAKLIVVGMVSNGFTIADPNDPGMLDVVGFDTATPQVIAEFSA
jgi:60 kDa SS-A/Ro ribonucleoprotein